ncbi:MAG: hypothetical protein Q9160_007335 [Pyrenula sp. 1 TL-2023]
MGSTILLPGERLPASAVPPKPRVGPNLYNNTSEGFIAAKTAGSLTTNAKKRAITLSPSHASYQPRVNDLVLGQVNRSIFEDFQVSLAPHTSPAILPQLAFENANKKSRPQLKQNDLVYAKVLSATRNMEVMLTCVDPATGKSEPEGLGPLNGGMVFDVSVGFAERLLRREGVSVLEELGGRLQGGFEIAVGRNGKVWVDCPESGIKGTLAVGRCLQESDKGQLTEEEQKVLVKRTLGG